MLKGCASTFYYNCLIGKGYKFNRIIYKIGPQSRTLQPVRGEGYEPAYKSKANAETHPRLGREVVVFREGSEKLYTGRVSPSKNNLPPAPQPLN